MARDSCGEEKRFPVGLRDLSSPRVTDQSTWLITLKHQHLRFPYRELRQKQVTTIKIYRFFIWVNNSWEREKDNNFFQQKLVGVQWIFQFKLNLSVEMVTSTEE